MPNKTKKNGKRLLVTGGLGFIGSNFVRGALTTKDWFVTNLDKQTYSGNPENLSDIQGNRNYRWIRGDISDRKVVDPLMAETDILVHFAAETHVDRSISDPKVFMQTNALGTQTLLESARSHSVQQVIHVSTDEVYGSVESGESFESDTLLPNSPYAASKAASDLIARAYHKTYGLPVIITRCSNNFGPYQYPEKALPLLITNAIEEKPFPLYGDGKQVRDWLYAVDHVKAIFLLIEKGKVGEIYNIGGTLSLSNKELFSRILALMEKPLSLLQHVDDRPAHDRRYALNYNKLRSLGWKPETSFEKALLETIQWYQTHEDWWRPLKKNSLFKNYYQKQYKNRFQK